MIAYTFLALFTLAAMIFIINSHYRWTYFFSIALFVFFFSGMLAISGQWQRALNFASVLFVALMLFHRLKIHYYKQPLLISDFFLVIDWRNWETLMHYKGALGGVIGLLALLGYAIFGWSSAEPLDAVVRAFNAVLFLISGALMWHYSKNPNAVQVWLDSLPDDGRDVFLNLPMSCRGIFFKVPQFPGDGEKFAARMNAQCSNPTALNAEIKPDIVVALLESTLNPHQFAFTKQNIPPLPMFERQNDTVFISPLRVHTFAGATWRSEFAFLAGLPPTDYGALANGVFYSVVPHLQSGLIKNLRAQGYFCVALSPFTKGNYNAKSAYDHFAFDLMLQPQDLGYPAPFSKNLWTISSEEMMAYTRMILEKKHPALENLNQPLFVYVLTMREHGPYNLEMENIYGLEMPALGAKSISSLNDYTQRIVALNDAVESMGQYLHERGKPFVFGYFGDHQVAFDNQIPAKKGDFPSPDCITQLIVRSNCAKQFEQTQDFLDLAFAGGLIMEIAGLQAKDDFMKANQAMRKLSDGRLEDAADKQLVNDYRSYLYQILKIAQ